MLIGKKKPVRRDGVMSPSSFLRVGPLLFHRREFILFVVKTTYLNESIYLVHTQDEENDLLSVP